MPYFKHAELVNRHHVSLKTVHNWIDSAKQGKIDLKLHQHGGRTYVADTPSNTAVLKNLTEQGKKYRNARYQAVATPKPEFYEMFSRKQILDIITSLKIHHEAPRQYNYIGEGAHRWDDYTRKLIDDGTPNILEESIKLLRANMQSIDALLEGHSRVNVIDIGPGNALPVRELLQHLLDKGVLHRYIAIDISPEMLHITERNIAEWFDNKIQVECHLRDISYEHFSGLLVDDMLGQEAEKTINVALLLGGTPTNFRKPTDFLRTIHDSMGWEDLIIYTNKPDTEAARRFLAGGVSNNSNHSYLFSMFNIDESMYDVEAGYNTQKRVRYIQVRLNRALRLSFDFPDGEHHVDFEKGDTILLWRSWHSTAIEIISQFQEVGFSLVHSSLTKDRQFMLTVSGLDIDSEVEA